MWISINKPCLVTLSAVYLSSGRYSLVRSYSSIIWPPSPSIWWNDHEILTYAEQFYSKGQELTTDKQKLLITVGSEESFMVDDAAILFSKLNEYALPNLEVKHYVAPNENHASVVPTIMSRAFRVLNC